MIESNVLNYIEIGDSIQLNNIYKNKFQKNFFEFFRIMIKYKSTNITLLYFLKFIYFIQIMMLCLINLPEKFSKHDTLIKFFNVIKGITYLHENITSKKTYYIWLYITYTINGIFIICILDLIIKRKNANSTILYLLNYFNLILQNYFYFPFLNILLIIFKCNSENYHHFLNIKCYESNHLILIIINLFFILFFTLYSILLSIYYYQIGGIKNSCGLARLNCNYELYENIISIILYFLDYFLEFYITKEEDNKKMRIVIRCIILCSAIFFFIYIFKYMMYYDFRMNNLLYFGWSFIFWFSLVYILQMQLKFINSILFVLLGWFFLSIIVYNLTTYNVDKFLVNINVLEIDNIKQIEMFTFNLLNLANENTVKSKILLNGLFNTIEEYFKNFEIYNKYYELSTNKYFIKEFKADNYLFNTYCIIYTIYDFYLNKNNIKNDVLLLYGYFLLNYLRNYSLIILLCSKIKIKEHKYMYLKYLLLEDIKEKMLDELGNKNSKDKDIKNLEIGSVIYYNNLYDNMKLKIYDALIIQINYFEIFKNSTNSINSTEKLLKIGKKILKYKKEILQIWNKIIELNNFSDEIEQDFMLYLENIIQDNDLVVNKKKEYLNQKKMKFSEKNNLYYSLFNKDDSSIIIIDGFSMRGKIIYFLSNFALLFGYNNKEIINFYIYDLMSSNISKFHSALERDMLCYSNLDNIFKGERKFFIKGKNGLITCIFFIRVIPNLSYGLVYIMYVKKIKENFMVILDNEFIINSISDLNYTSSIELFNKNNFDLNNSIIGKHVGYILPEFLKLLTYKNEKFDISKTDIDIKGNFYSNIKPNKKIDSLINKIIENIKANGFLNLNDYVKKYSIRKSIRNNLFRIEKNNGKDNQYNYLLKELEKFSIKNIFFKISLRSFLKGKYSYIQIYIIPNISNNMNNIIQNSNLKNSAYFGTRISSSNNSMIHFEFKENKNNNNNLKGIKIATYSIKEKENNNNNNNIKENKIDIKTYYEKSKNINKISYNRIKNKILSKKYPLYIIYIYFLLIIFEVSTIILESINSLIMKEKFNNIQVYFNQNFFFNRTKIHLSALNFILSNIKLLKYDAINNEKGCLIPCINGYMFSLDNIFEKITNSIKNTKYYDDDYKKIFNQYDEILVYINKMETIKYIHIDKISRINFIFSNALRIYHNIYNYLDDSERKKIFETYMENALNQSYLYIINDTFGFSNEKLHDIIQNRFSNFNYLLIINSVIYVIICILFIFISSKLYKFESKILKKLLYFRNYKFEIYLKYLDELKRKLRKDNGEEEEKNQEDEKFSSNNNNNNEENKISEQNETKKFDKIKRKNSNLTGNEKKKKKTKINKIFQQKQEKYNIMKKYFRKLNIILSIKLNFILIIGMSYYIFINLIYLDKRNDFFEYNKNSGILQYTFLNIFISFLNLKIELINNINFEEIKKFYINCFNSNTFTSLNFSDNFYTIENYTLINNLKYLMDIPSSINSVSYSKDLTNLLNKNEDENYYKIIYKLFYGNSCEILVDGDKTNEDNILLLRYCQELWSGILKKGLEQGITQFYIEFVSVIEIFNNTNNGKVSFYEISNYPSTLFYLDFFLSIYFYKAFIIVDENLEKIRINKVSEINKILNFISIIYTIFIGFLFIIGIFFINNNYKKLISFLNFILIIPVEYLSEDEYFYSEILKMENYFT